MRISGGAAMPSLIGAGRSAVNGVVRIISLGWALLFAALPAMTATARESETATITQDVAAGELTYALSGGTMETMTFDLQHAHPRVTNGSIVLTVTDTRGSFTGWTIAVESTPFVYSGRASGAHDIPAMQAVVIPQTPMVLDGQGLDGIDVPAPARLDTRVPVLTAATGAGSGSYQQEILIQLTVPPQQPAGTYTASFTVSSSAAPGT